MDKAVSAAAANRDFSKLLRGVREGRSYVITVLFERLRTQRAIRPIARWTRDELYEDH